MLSFIIVLYKICYWCSFWQDPSYCSISPSMLMGWSVLCHYLVHHLTLVWNSSWMLPFCAICLQSSFLVSLFFPVYYIFCWCLWFWMECKLENCGWLVGSIKFCNLCWRDLFGENCLCLSVVSRDALLAHIRLSFTV